MMPPSDDPAPSARQGGGRRWSGGAGDGSKV